MPSLSSSSRHPTQISHRKKQDDPYRSILNEDQDQEEEEEEEDDLESRSGTPPQTTTAASSIMVQGIQDSYNEMIADDDDDEMIIDSDEELDPSSVSQVVRSQDAPHTWLTPSISQVPTRPQDPSHLSSHPSSINQNGPYSSLRPPPLTSPDEDEDDAQIMARLMARHHERQEAGDRVVQVQESQVAREARVVEDQESSDKARLFLEGLCLDFLNQLYMSEKVMAAQSRAKSRGKGKKGKNRDLESEDEEEVEGNVGVRIALKNRKTGGDHVVKFPDDPVTWTENQVGSSMLRIARILCVASLMYEACVTGFTTTKRDIYYKDVRLFGTQAVVDQLVDDIVAIAGLKRKHFNVCAASKGLIVSSCLEILLKSGDKLICSGSNPALIPPVERMERIESITPPEWVLIVEKDAVFQPLCGMRLLEDERLGPGVIVTGKGYPDLATLQLLALIADHYPSTKFYGLFDADPHGLDILSVYTSGSHSSRFSQDHSDLPLRDRLQWLGVKASEFFQIGVKHDDLLPLTEKDVQKANAMLRDPLLRSECQRELIHMLHLNRKAEIQVILGASLEGDESMEWTESGPGMLLDYLVTRMTV